MASDATLYIVPRAADEGRFWAERLASVPAQTVLLVREARRPQVLMALVRAWEECSGNSADYWIGSLWDIPLVRRFLKQLRTQPEQLVFQELASLRNKSFPKAFADRDQEALRCFAELLHPRGAELSTAAWRELT